MSDVSWPGGGFLPSNLAQLTNVAGTEFVDINYSHSLCISLCYQVR